MQVNQICVVAEQLPLLLLSNAGGVQVVALADVLVRQDHLWLAVNVAWGFHVVQCQVVFGFVLIHLEVEVFPGDNFVVSGALESLLINLALEVMQHQFLLNYLVDLVLDFAD